jgi:hypothetical protein
VSIVNKFSIHIIARYYDERASKTSNGQWASCEFTSYCQNGTVPSGGCVVNSTSQGLYGSNYTLFGDISSGSSVGITIDAINGTTTTYNGDILTTGNSAAGVYIRSGNTNSFSINGNIDTSGSGAYGLYLLDSDNNTLTVNRNITTTGLYAFSIYNGDTSVGNNYIINGLVQMNDNLSNGGIALRNIGGIDNLTIASSAGLKATANDTLAYGIRNVDGATIASLNNAGSIQAVATNSKSLWYFKLFSCGFGSSFNHWNINEQWIDCCHRWEHSQSHLKSHFFD